MKDQAHSDNNELTSIYIRLDAIEKSFEDKCALKCSNLLERITRHKTEFTQMVNKLTDTLDKARGRYFSSGLTIMLFIAGSLAGGIFGYGQLTTAVAESKERIARNTGRLDGTEKNIAELEKATERLDTTQTLELAYIKGILEDIAKDIKEIKKEAK